MAANVYEDLAKRYPDRSDYVEILSKIYLQQKDYKKMLSALNRLEVLEGQSEDLTLTKMQIYSYMGEQEGAHEDLVRLVKNHPNDLSYRVMLGKKVRKAEKSERPSVLAKLSQFKELVKHAVVDRNKRKELER